MSSDVRAAPHDTTAATAARRPIGVRLLPDVWHYGWWVAIAIAVVMFATVGVGYYGLAVFLRPLQEENGWSNAWVSGATGLYFAVSGLAGLLIGPTIDRRGPLRPMALGITLVGASSLLLGFVDELYELFAVYTLQAIGFGLAGSVAINSIVAHWFVTKRAKAMSISATGVSMGGIVLSPLGTWMVSQGGVSLAATVMGLLVLVVGLPIVAFVLVWDPAEIGLTPDAGAPDRSFRNDALSDEVQQRIWTRGAAARTVAFWAILVAFVLALLAQTGFLLHQIAFLTDRFGSANRAALALSTTAFGSVVARFALGQVADRMNKRLLSSALFVIQGAAILGLLATTTDSVISYLLVLVVGFTIGNIYMMQTLLVGETFGLASLATVFGVIGLAAQIASGVGPGAIGIIQTATGPQVMAVSLRSRFRLWCRSDVRGRRDRAGGAATCDGGG